MIRFFTDISTNISRFCLLNVKQYNNLKKKNKALIYIDPSVYELKEKSEYSKIDLLHELAGGKLKENEWISIDYPTDMNLQFQDEFIEKSIKNNLKYKENPQYIATVQCRFEDFADFKRQFEYLEEQIDFTKKIVGIGNLCRIMKPDLFTDKLFSYLLNKPKYQYHFYGLSLSNIKTYLYYFVSRGQIVSVDSTKWTKACNSSLKRKYGLNCKKNTRDLYFLEYMNEIRKSGINVIF